MTRLASLDEDVSTLPGQKKPADTRCVNKPQGTQRTRLWAVNASNQGFDAGSNGHSGTHGDAASRQTTPRIVPTGVIGFDAKLGRGFQSGSTLLVLAEASHAPYVFCEQFAATGLQRGEKVLYYSLDRPQSDARPRIQSLVGNGQAGAGLEFFDCYSQRFKGIDVSVLRRLGVHNHSPHLPKHLMARLLGLNHGQSFRLVLESLSETIEVYGLAAGMDLLNQMSAVVRTMNGMAVVMMIRGEQPQSVEARARHLADCVIEFGVDGHGPGLHTYLAISKLKAPEGEGQVLAYKIGGRGIVLDTYDRVV